MDSLVIGGTGLVGRHIGHPGSAGEDRWGHLTLAAHDYPRRGHRLKMRAHLALYQKMEFNAQ